MLRRTRPFPMCPPSSTQILSFLPLYSHSKTSAKNRTNMMQQEKERHKQDDQMHQQKQRYEQQYEQPMHRTSPLWGPFLNSEEFWQGQQAQHHVGNYLPPDEFNHAWETSLDSSFSSSPTMSPVSVSSSSSNVALRAWKRLITREPKKRASNSSVSPSTAAAVNSSCNVELSN